MALASLKNCIRKAQRNTHTREDLGTLHLPVERKEKPLTETQFRERVEEVEAIVNAYTDEYNAPEAKAKREAEHQELQRIGALRKAAYDRGESMDAYPLPWERKGAEV